MAPRIRSSMGSGRTLRALQLSQALLSPAQRRRYRWAVGAQLATSVLDLIGVLLLGLVGLLAASAVSGQSLPTQVSTIVAALGLGALTPLNAALILASCAAVMLLTKTALFGLLAHRIYRFLGQCHADVASRAAREFSGMPIWFVEGRSSQESSYAIYLGTQAAILGVLGSFAIVASELTLLLLVGTAMLAIDPFITLVITLLMGTVAAISHRRLARRMSSLGVELGGVAIETTQTIQEQVSSFRELVVLDRQQYVTDRVAAVVTRGAGAMADSQFIVQVPKLIYETALVLGAALVAGWLILTKNPEAAIGSLALFLAAGSRVVPSLLRATNQAVSLSHSAGQAEPAYLLIGDMRAIASPRMGPDRASSLSPQGEFVPRVTVSAVTFTYPNREIPALRDVSLEIDPGTHVALVGSSGAGKSTLADVILGIQQPDTGEARLGGVDAAEATHIWRGRIAYVPQTAALIDGTFRDNVALGLPDDHIDDVKVWRALELAHLSSFVSESPSGLDTHVGERGVKLSGGQRQRLGLARGLYSEPTLLVLDEATSALDAETESLIGQTVASLAGTVTRVTVAHRLATIRSADQVIYLASGVIAARGSFDYVREAVPEFDRQAAILGLS